MVTRKLARLEWNDLLIAAIALSHDLTLVTGNVREFRRVNKLRWEDWEDGRS